MFILLTLIVLAAMTMSSTTSFAGETPDDLLRRHVVMFSNSGAPLDPASPGHELEPAEIESHIQQIIEGVEQFRKGDKQDEEANHPRKRIVIYAHGGLKTFGASLDHAQRLIPEMLDDDTYPIFLIWSSNLFVSFWDQTVYLRRDFVPTPVEQAIHIPAFLTTTVATGIARLIPTWRQQVTDDLSTLSRTLLSTQLGVIAQYEHLDSLQQTDPGRAVNVSWAGGKLGFPREISRFWLYFRTLPIKLVTSPLISDVGDNAWHSMRRRANHVFRRPGDFLGTIRDDLPDGSGGLTLYLNRVEERLRSEEIDLVLIGYSMGSIILCEMIRRWPDLPYKDIVFMAAACSIREFETSLLPVLTRPGSEVRFYNLSLHPDAELREINGGDMPHRGSLLNWIDNFYSTPETWMDRTLGKWGNAIPAAHIIPPEARSRVTLKAFGLGRNPEPEPGAVTRGLAVGRPGPQRHDDFVEYSFWNEEFWAARKNPNPETASFHSGWILHGGYGAMQAGGRWTPFVEGGVGALLHRTAYFGLRAKSPVGESMSGFPIAPNELRRNLDMNEVGLDMDYVDAHFTTGTFIGGGRAVWEDPAGNEPKLESEYLVIEPSTLFHFQLGGHTALELGGGYRFVTGANEPGFSGESLSGWIFGARLDLGQFEMNRWHPAN